MIASLFHRILARRKPLPRAALETPAPAALIGRNWIFRWDQGEVITRHLTLLENGRIGGTGKHHVYWDIIDQCLCFLNEERYCTFRFNITDRRDDGTYAFSGRCTVVVSHVRTASLTEICIPLSSVVEMFESLGDNCEFGILQRYYGTEPLGLLRFSWISMASLIKGLAERFAALDAPEAITVQLTHTGEYFGIVKAYGMQFHTGKTADRFTAEEVTKTVRQALLFTRRKFLEDVQEGNKIYVRKGEGSATLEQILPLHEILQSLGRNTLLWVTLSDGTHPPGHAEQIQQGLWRGYVPAFAPNNNVAARVNAHCWAKICRTVANAIAPAAAMVETSSTIKWTALEKTFVKASTVFSASLKEEDKIAVNEGDMVEAESAELRDGHIEVTAARLNGVQLPERRWFLYMHSWARL